MADQHYPPCADTVLRRPAVDPCVPGADRALLTANSALLAPAGWDRPACRRDYLPAEPAKRLATIEAAVMGMTAALVTAVFGTVPLAVGVLLVQEPTGWEHASNRYSLLLAQVIALVTVVLLGVRVARFGQPSGKVPAAMAARAYHGQYLTDADFDTRARVLLRHAQDAIDTVTLSKVVATGLLDGPAATAALASQEWDIAVALREQARLRARRSELPPGSPRALAAAMLDRQVRAAQLADSSVANRVAALEHYAAEVRAADAAYRDWQHAAVVAELDGPHLDMAARTAADEHGIAELTAMTLQARTLRRSLREPPS